MKTRNLQVEHAPELFAAQPSPELSSRGMKVQRWDTERIATIGIWIVIAYTTIKSVFSAMAKPLWYDEILTVAAAHQPSFAAVWSALTRARDSSPLFYTFVEHLSALFVSNQQIAYRLPSIIGFGCILWCLFVFIRRHEGGVCAFLCSTILMLTPLYKLYAIEARSYILAVACISIALVCYQHVPRRPWILLFGLALASAEAFHYFAFFSFVAFFMAELAWTAKLKKIRWGVWLALAAGFLPLLAAWPLLREIKSFYGSNFWGKPTFKVVEVAYDGFFPGAIVRIVPWLGLVCMAILSVAVILIGRYTKSPNRTTEQTPNSYESLLAVGLLGVPLVAFAVAKIGNGTLTGRYLIAMILGIAIAASYMLRLPPRRELVLVVLTGFVLVGVGGQEMLFWMGGHREVASASSSADSLGVILGSAGEPDLPVVVSRGITYLEVAYYAPPELSRRLVGIVDAPNAVKYSGIDSVDRQLPVLTCCLPLHVDEFRSFAADHSRFFMYSDANFDWWPIRLRKEGYLLERVASDKDHNLYLVNQGRGAQ